MQIAIKVVVALMALLFVVLGAGVMFDPGSAPTQFGVEAQNLVGLSTLRGDLGGMFIGSAVLLVWGLVSGRTGLLLAVAVLMLAIAGGRVVGFVLDGISAQVIMPFVVELVIAAVLLFAWRRSPPVSG